MAKLYRRRIKILGITGATPPYNTLIPLTDISPGVDFNQRNGRSIKAKSLQLRYVVKFPDSSTLDHVTVRIVVVMTKSLEGNTVPLASDIYEYDAAAKQQMVNAFRANQTDNALRYTVLMDKRLTLDKDYKSEIVISKFIKCRHHIRWIGSTGTDYGYGHLFTFYIVDNDNTAGTNTVQVQAQSRFKYVDN